MNEIVALLESLRPILERWYLLLFAIILVTLLGIPARVLVSALAALLRVPAMFTRAEIDPPLRRATPTAPYRLRRSLRGCFRPVLDRPGRALTGAAGGLFFTARNAANWPVAAITGAIVGLFSPLVDQAATHAENGSDRLGAQARSSAGALRGNSERWAGWRVIGGFLFFGGLLLFLFADAALSLASHEKAIGASVTFLPAWILVVGALALVMLVVALVLRAVSRALPPLAVLLGGILRVLGIAGLVLLIGVVALAAGIYFVVSVVAVGVIFAGAFAALLLWAAVWLVAEALVYAIRLIAKIADALELVLHRLIDAVMYPGRVLWNWIASFDRARAIHLQPIRSVEARALRLAPGDEPPALEEAAR